MSGTVRRFAALGRVAMPRIVTFLVDVLAATHGFAAQLIIGGTMGAGVRAVKFWSDFFHQAVNADSRQKVH